MIEHKLEPIEFKYKTYDIRVKEEKNKKIYPQQVEAEREDVNKKQRSKLGLFSHG